MQRLHFSGILFLAAFSPSLHSMAYVKALPIRQKKIAITCGAIGLTLYCAKTYYNCVQLHKSFEHNQMLFNDIKKKYQNNFTLAPLSQLIEKYVDHGAHTCTFDVYEKQIRDDLQKIQRIRLSLNTINTHAAYSLRTGDVQIFEDQLTQFIQKIEIASRQLNLHVLNSKYNSQIAEPYQKVSDAQQLHGYICAQYNNLSNPYPYVLCYKDLENAIKELETAQENITDAHNLVQESVRIISVLNAFLQWVKMQDLYLQQADQLVQNRLQEQQLQTLQCQNRAQQQMNDLLQQNTALLHNIFTSREGTTNVLYAMLQTLQNSYIKVSCIHTSCLEKIKYTELQRAALVQANKAIPPMLEHYHKEEQALHEIAQAHHNAQEQNTQRQIDLLKNDNFQLKSKMCTLETQLKNSWPASPSYDQHHLSPPVHLVLPRIPEQFQPSAPPVIYPKLENKQPEGHS